MFLKVIMSLLSMPTTGSAAAMPADKEESEDLFSAHDFDVQIDMALPGITLISTAFQ